MNVSTDSVPCKHGQAVPQFLPICILEFQFVYSTYSCCALTMGWAF